MRRKLKNIINRRYFKDFQKDNIRRSDILDECISCIPESALEYVSEKDKENGGLIKFTIYRSYLRAIDNFRDYLKRSSIHKLEQIAAIENELYLKNGFVDRNEVIEIAKQKGIKNPSKRPPTCVRLNDVLSGGQGKFGKIIASINSPNYNNINDLQEYIINRAKKYFPHGKKNDIICYELIKNRFLPIIKDEEPMPIVDLSVSLGVKKRKIFRQLKSEKIESFFKEIL